MKRYIRTKDNKIWDKTIHKIESVTYLTVPTVEKYKLYIFNNHEELIGQYFCTDIIAESDNVFDLIQLGDLVISGNTECVDIPNAIIVENITTITDEEGNEYISYNSNTSAIYDEFISQIYTPQNGNFILVWDKERGVI